MDCRRPAKDGEEALSKIEESKPDVAVLDLRMPRLTGIEVARRAVRSTPDSAVNLYTAYGERALVTQALDAAHADFC